MADDQFTATDDLSFANYTAHDSRAKWHLTRLADTPEYTWLSLCGFGGPRSLATIWQGSAPVAKVCQGCRKRLAKERQCVRCQRWLVPVTSEEIVPSLIGPNGETEETVFFCAECQLADPDYDVLEEE